MAIEDNFPLEQLTPIAKIESGAKQWVRPIYSMHKWWAGRLGSIFRTICLSVFTDSARPEDVWEKYLQKNDLDGKIVYDPFMGQGTTIAEALRLKCKAIGVDINPVAWWTARKMIEKVDVNNLMKTFKELEKKVAEDIKYYYKTKCPKCGRTADVMYYLWVKEIPCISCSNNIYLFRNYILYTDKNTGALTLLCPKCWHVFEQTPTDGNAKCPACSLEFDPYKSMVGGGNYNCTCGQKYSILKTLQRNKHPPNHKLYAIEYLCPTCSKRGYKRIDENDRKLFQEAKERFDREKDKLLFPQQKIPPGVKTNALLNYNYTHFYQMFNERELLCLSILLKAILEIEGKNEKKLLLTCFSNALNFNSIFTFYNGGRRELEPVFTLHAYHIPNTPAENNVWGAKLGRGTFRRNFDMLVRAKKYNISPYEKIKKKGKTEEFRIPGEVLDGKFCDTFEELTNNGNVMLRCQTSEKIDLPSNSVDAVITDPPYFDNVMYSELADFFYVWLREALKDEYEEFKPELSPKLNEIVKNKVQGKDEQFFIDGITRVFKECHRVLKGNGPMVFTYHHKQSQAWAAVLEAILQSNFQITAMYPIESEILSSIHIKNVDAIEYDAIIVCRKRTDEKAITFEKYEEELYLKAKDIIENERKKRPTLSKGDISVIVFGKCLEIYSKYYPHVTDKGEDVSVEEATNKVWEIIDQLKEEEDYIPFDLDPITRAFTANMYEPSRLTYDELNKRLRPKGIDISELDAEKLITGPKNDKQPADPFDRKSFIEKKLSRGEELLEIDKVQYLYILYTTDKNPEWLRKWKTPHLEQLCKILAEKTGDQRYGDVMKLTLDMF
jgi:adenine-specific DNA methylase